MFSEFNTQNVIDMSYMFSNCSSLNELNLSFFNTEKVKNMKYMFGECWSLKKLIFPNLTQIKLMILIINFLNVFL